jgi:hypothetical protein
LGLSLVGSLLIGAGATIAIVWMGVVKEHHWDLAREKANQQIAALTVQAEQLRRDTAEANARAAEANAKAEEEKLARVKIEARIAPRGLSQAQQNELTEKMQIFRNQRGTITTSPATPERVDPIRSAAADTLAAALRELGIDATAVPAMLHPPQTIAITITPK